MRDCNQCGKCCIKYGGGDLAVTREEIDYWETHRPEISAYVQNDEIWFDPDTGHKLTTCPFLELMPNKNPDSKDKYSCRIYQHRPEDCRQYPSLIAEMVRDGCEMIEPGDLDNPRQAQTQLRIYAEK